MPQSEVLTADEIDLSEYPTGFLGCRDMRHSWGRRPVYWVTVVGEKCRILLCTECGTMRHDRQYGKPRYEYPDGYRLEDRVERGVFREEAYRRAKTYKTEDQALKVLLGGTGTNGKRPQQQRARVIDLRDGATRRTGNRRRATQTARRRSTVSA